MAAKASTHKPKPGNASHHGKGDPKALVRALKNADKTKRK